MSQVLHAHRCKKCLDSKVQTIWVHDESAQGIAASHTCPKCGTINWEKFMVQPHRHKVTAAVKTVPLEMILGYMALFLIGCVVIGMIVAMSRRGEKS